MRYQCTEKIDGFSIVFDSTRPLHRYRFFFFSIFFHIARPIISRHRNVFYTPVSIGFSLPGNSGQTRIHVLVLLKKPPRTTTKKHRSRRYCGIISVLRAVMTGLFRFYYYCYY